MMIAAGIIYAFTESTLEGKLILLVLFLASIFSWSVMVTKIRFLSFCKRQNDRFQDLFHQDRQPLRIFEAGVAFEGSNIFEIYEAGANELCFQMLGSIEVDESFASRLKTAEKITPAQMRAVQAAMERAVGESALRLESKMIVLSTAVSGAPFLGLLGTVWGVMEVFTAVSMQASANLQTLAPGVSAALMTTIAGLVVAIPSVFGYNALLTKTRQLTTELENFSSALADRLELESK
jgi:biopolymer transport protein ExbB/TolQ